MNYKDFLSQVQNELVQHLNSNFRTLNNGINKLCTMFTGSKIDFNESCICSILLEIDPLVTEIQDIEGLRIEVEFYRNKKGTKIYLLNCDCLLSFWGDNFSQTIENLEDSTINKIEVIDGEVQIDFDSFILTIKEFINNICIPRMIKEVNTFFNNEKYHF